ncbi:MAG TPA: hypothetical protein VL155_10860 [Terriglobales bacterium]|jgi:hypothetical protein|nr:hypothetical protein [Terriglobales bacterium]
MQRGVALVRKHPLGFVGISAGAVFVIALLMHLAGGNATLKVQMQHSFRSAQVSVWVDGDLACSERVVGSERRRFGLLPAGIGGSFSRLVPVSAGRHTVKVRVTSDEGYDNNGTVTGDFPQDSQMNLQVIPRRSGDLGMNWQGTITLLADSGSAWYVKYGGSLLMTAVGSLVSAVMAYIVKELPNLLRRPSAPKA